MASVAPVRHLRPSNSTIDDQSEKSYYWSQLLKYWKLPSHVKHFPGANPMSIERADLQQIKESDFLVALKTDGVRHILLLTLKPNSMEPIAIMVDRAQKMYEIIVWANEDYFTNGSLMDGELVWSENGLQYIIFDVMVTKGTSCIKMPYRDRLQILHNTILVINANDNNQEEIERKIAEEDKIISFDNIHNLQILSKRCVKKENLHILWRDRNNVCHANDGLVFTLNTANVTIGTCSTILKWKPDHSVDIQIVYSCSKGLCLYANDNTSGAVVDITRSCCSYKIEFTMNRLIEVIKHRLPCIVECLIQIKEDVMYLTPERERGDKDAPNTIKTIEATIKNTIEAISSEELIGMVCG